MNKLVDYIGAAKQYHPVREIDGHKVVISEVNSEHVRQDGRLKTKYYITLDTGETYISWSPNINRVLDNIPLDDFPVEGTFILKDEDGKVHWTVE